MQLQQVKRRNDALEQQHRLSGRQATRSVQPAEARAKLRAGETLLKRAKAAPQTRTFTDASRA